MNDVTYRIQSELTYVGSDSNELYYKFIKEVNDVIAKYPTSAVEIGLNYIINSNQSKPWTPISLSKDNFNKNLKHKRAWYIGLDNKGIYNILAYKLKVRKAYAYDEKGVSIELPEHYKNGDVIDEKIYISKGGIINGDYIYKSYLKHQTGEYNIKNPINIPVSVIETAEPDMIFFVDHREPKLKALMDFYDVTIQHDNNVKFNIRTFKK